MTFIEMHGGGLLRQGIPHRIVSGSLHYFRVHPDQWADRLDRLAAMGVNTLDTYIAWNWHEERPGELRWQGSRDVERFIRLAGERGLDVMLRPGPYICAEWDNGGLPAWLTATPGLTLRSSDPLYLDAVESWFAQLLPRLAPLQAGSGGPIVAWQIENEYGSYADDPALMEFTRLSMLRHGASEFMYTADGPTHLMQDGGSLSEVMSAATFGSGPEEAFALLRARRPSTALMCAEYWNGWFDHWGEKHHVRTPESVASDVESMLAANGSLSIYMAHGGTNFGLWAGSNFDRVLQPTITSYDSDAPIAEDGRLTPKWHALRRTITEALGTVAPDPPPDPRLLPAAAWETRVTGQFIDPAAAVPGILAECALPEASPRPPTFEQLGLSSGMVLYRAHPVVPVGGATLFLEGVRDLATVMLDGVVLGRLDAESGLSGLALVGDGRAHRLEVLVEAYGHINYGPLLGEQKGLLGVPRLDRRRIDGWVSQPLDLSGMRPDELAAAGVPTARQSASPKSLLPASGALAGLVATAEGSLSDVADGHLILPGWGRGYLWINETMLGRYNSVGPQRSYYVPAPLLRSGRNRITLLEMECPGADIAWVSGADLGETEQYIEVFE